MALRRITRASDLHSRLLLQRYGLKSPQLAALQVLERMQPMCAGTLARELRLSQGTVTGVLGRLEKRAFIHRTRGTQDRRSVHIELTDAGAKVVAEGPSLLQDRFRRELSRLRQWERTMILATLQRIAAMMDAEEMRAMPVLATGMADAREADTTGRPENATGTSDHGPFAEEAPTTLGGPARIGEKGAI